MTQQGHKGSEATTTGAKVIQKNGGREGIRTPGLLIANGESLKLRRVATIS